MVNIRRNILDITDFVPKMFPKDCSILKHQPFALISRRSKGLGYFMAWTGLHGETGGKDGHWAVNAQASRHRLHATVGVIIHDSSIEPAWGGNAYNYVLQQLQLSRYLWSKLYFSPYKKPVYSLGKVSCRLLCIGGVFTAIVQPPAVKGGRHMTKAISKG